MGKFDDIISLPHHVSTVRPHMSASDRAAQFSPFEALTGYEDIIREEGRLTDSEIRDEQKRICLNEKLQYLNGHLHENIRISVIRFVPDANKSGGKYEIAEGQLKKIDLEKRRIVFYDGTGVPMDSILEIDISEQGETTDKNADEGL